MPKKKPGRIVIDACIARSAGGKEAKKGHSVPCTNFLSKVLEICYMVIFSRELFDEWKEHQSKFSRRWLVTMFSRKKVNILKDSEDQSLRGRIRSECEIKKRSWEAVLKDIHLIEAAIITDKIIASIDDRARDHFKIISPGFGELRLIYRINPANTDEDVVSWLESGLEPDTNRLLSN